MNVSSRTAFVAIAATTAWLLTIQTTNAQQSITQTSQVKTSREGSAMANSAVPPVTGGRTRSRVVDVALQDDGVIRGRVLHADGSPIDGSRVILRKGERIVAAVISRQDGQFSVKGLTSGVYQIETPTSQGTYRFWTRGAAPPAAMSRALIVSKEPLLRGQFGNFSAREALSLAVGTTGLVIGAVALNDVNDLEDRIDRLVNQGQPSQAQASP